MGCQRKICDQIIEKEADYVLSLKGNQGNLHKDIKLFFEEQHSKNFADIKADYFETTDGEHGRIENSVHWVLDMTFNEDYSRVRDENAAENLAIVRHIALNAVQKSKHEFKGSSIRNIRKKAGWDNNLMDKIAQNIFS